MKLLRLAIFNYKSIDPKGISVDFRNGFSALVGRNNAGKSNIIETVAILFGSKNPRYLKFGPEAFNSASQSLVIEAEIAGLDWGVGKQLGLSDQQCAMLTKSSKKDGCNPGNILMRLTVPPCTPDAEEDTPNDDESEETEARQTFQLFLANINEVKRKNDDIRKALVKYV